MSGVDIEATARRDGKWWLIEFDSPAGKCFTQAKRLDQVEFMVRDLCDLDGVPVNSVTVLPVLPELNEITESREASNRAAEASAAASKKSRELVGRLRDQGLSVRDVATLLGITPQRVSQLAK